MNIYSYCTAGSEYCLQRTPNAYTTTYIASRSLLEPQALVFIARSYQATIIDRC